MQEHLPRLEVVPEPVDRRDALCRVAERAVISQSVALRQRSQARPRYDGGIGLGSSSPHIGRRAVGRCRYPSRGSDHPTAAKLRCGGASRAPGSASTFGASRGEPCASPGRSGLLLAAAAALYSGSVSHRVARGAAARAECGRNGRPDRPRHSTAGMDGCLTWPSRGQSGASEGGWRRCERTWGRHNQQPRERRDILAVGAAASMSRVVASGWSDRCTAMLHNC